MMGLNAKTFEFTLTYLSKWLTFSTIFPQSPYDSEERQGTAMLLRLIHYKFEFYLQKSGVVLNSTGPPGSFAISHGKLWRVAFDPGLTRIFM